jgi:hypothetical protein
MCHQLYCNKPCEKCALHCCRHHCKNRHPPIWRRLTSASYVCNGCSIRSCRQNAKYYYRIQVAEQTYLEVLSDARKAINKTALEIDDLDRIISSLLKQGQPLNHPHVEPRAKRYSCIGKNFKPPTTIGSLGILFS